MRALSKLQRNSCAYCSGAIVLRADTSSASGSTPVSTTVYSARCQVGSCCASLVQVMEMVLAHGRTNERRPSLAVRQRWPHHLTPHAGRICPYSSNTAPSRYRPRRASGLSAPKIWIRRSPVRSTRNSASLIFVPGKLACEVFEQVPGNHLALAIEGRQVAVARAWFGVGVGVGNELVEGEDGFAKSPVTDPDVKALAMVVEGTLVFPQWGEVHHERLRN